MPLPFSQNEDLAALTAQQYYVEMGDQMNPDRLARMIPSVIPDSFLAGPGMQEKWMQMTIASYNRVSKTIPSLHYLTITAKNPLV